jgi:hypothetical protein
MGDRPTCRGCGRFFVMHKNTVSEMVYSGFPPEPDHEIYWCDICIKPAAPTVDAITSNTHNHGNKS